MNSLRRSLTPHLAALARRQSCPPKPPTIKRRNRYPVNNCSLIGQIAAPIRVFNGGKYPDKAGVYTVLQIKEPLATENNKCSPLRILLNMRGELAQICIEYIKPKQFVYISGHLCSYDKFDASGSCFINYKVEVSELNFVQVNNQKEVQFKSEDLNKKDSTFSPLIGTSSTNSDDENYEDKNRERLILWQIFFANPYEWKDYRAKKLSINFPDFKHKSTGECLWIRDNDPIWVKNQIKLYDSNNKGFKKKENFGLRRWEMRDFD